ncbi:ATP-dependent helicase HrpB [Putridiphycobacter roseus]|uniref:ATP-dependent helicase HrpB n=1 Tax=Putridiphycobacter roseus TaxID=2219161 RepID=A0A2W1NJZ6_9FLAO|nr:ATP-dependent helicase HrpB [Putridiphycobacter roseus]PZE15962.1 ATP-dependent helicase HrpB [Putridiphycobacter roseus]
MPFNINDHQLPIVSVTAEVKEKLIQHNTLILSAPPGAGKSTLLPLALLDMPFLKGQKIVMLEPRRLAAKTIAQRLADLLGEKVGDSIGYRIRFESKTSANTKLEILTEGILTRMLQSDNGLEGIGMIIFDEFHERSIHADVALALARASQEILRPELRILVMSATLNMPELIDLLKAPFVQSEGRQYPIDVKYVDQNDEQMMAETTAQVVKTALKQEEGDILVFLPGQREIKNCASILRRSFDDLAVHELYGKLPYSAQQAAIMPNRDGKRKVVIATAIAETSLTIEGVKVVVDSGWGRKAKYDPKTGLSGLVTYHISKDSADQRAGRAGRLSPGTCYRMWSKGKHAQLAKFNVPEILEADLTPLVLELAAWGINDPNTLTWLSPPPAYALKEGTATLESLNAIKDSKLTEHGKAIQKLPCHPRIAHLLLMAIEDDQAQLGTDLAAILEEKDPLPRETGIDINLRIEALRRSRKQDKKGGKFSKIEKVASQYRRMLKIEVDNATFDPFDTGLLLVHAYPERIAFARPGNNAQFQLANGKFAMAGHKDDLAYEPWLAIAHMNDSDKMGRIYLASPLNPTDLKPFVKNVETIQWNSKKGGLIATKDTRIGSIILQSKPILDIEPAEIVAAISEAIIKEGAHLLDFNEEVQQWQNRIITLQALNPNLQFPKVDTASLLANNETWLAPYLNGIKKAEDLKKINLLEVLTHSLDFEQQKTLNKLAPTKIEVPSGSHIKLDYQANGTTPILPVRLQEVFGLMDTPTINEGKTAVLMHLLSPGFKLVQITGDLSSFWENAYFAVRKEMRAKYKRHAWPENPLEHPAISGTKRRNGL